MFETDVVTKPGGQVRINVPITKVDKESRIVSGFATLDNVDKEGDVVTAEASQKAFAKWRGNIREMHQPLAVGKAVNFEVKNFTAEDGQTYTGMFVNAYISKGAQNTFDKVLDGTLTGFSIGGGAPSDAIEVEKLEDGRTIRKINNYVMTELSLVDNPGNQYANLVSLAKNTMTGASVVELLDAYYNENNEEFLLVKTEGLDEPDVFEGYEYKGRIEGGDGKLENFKKLLGGNMETVEEVEEMSETVEEQPSLQESFEKFAANVTKTLEGVVEAATTNGKDTKETLEKLEGVDTKLEEQGGSLEELSKTVSELQTRLEKVEETGAEQQSGNVEAETAEEEAVEEDSKVISKTYKGTFLPRRDFFNA